MADDTQQMQAAQDAEQEAKRRKKRHYGDSCSACKHGKRRCEGGSASQACTYCVKTGKFCSLTSETTTLTLNSVEAIMGAPRSASRTPSSTPAASSSRGASTAQQQAQPSTLEALMQTDAVTRTPKLLFSLGPDGRLEHFGESSHLHQPLLDQIAPGPVLPLSAVTPSLDRRFDVLAHAAVCALEEGICITPAESTLLIDTFFCWQVSQFLTVQRHLFMRDMALGGKYYNKFLLYTIYAQASRHVPSFKDRADLFENEARRLLGHHIHQNDYPTIQALLSFGGRDCALGKWSTGWVYIGIAIRMVQDRGLHLQLSAKEPEERNAQLQLVWSAYVWDKAVSVWLGRMPMLQLCPNMPCPLIDIQCDAESWQPLCETLLSASYPPQPNYQTECFKYSCKIWRFIDETYRELYSAVAERSLTCKAYLPQTRKALDVFWETIPHHLAVDTAQMPYTCPPPHIVTMNAMLRASWILLYRPFYKQYTDWDIPDAAEICLQRAEEIRCLLLLHERTFALHNLTYLMSYAAFVGATVFVLQLQEATYPERLAIIHKLDIFRRALASGARYTPGIAQSLALIEARAALAPAASVASEYPLPAESSSYASSGMPHNVGVSDWGESQNAPHPGPSAAAVSEAGSTSFAQLDFRQWMNQNWNCASFNFFDELAPGFQPN